MKNKVIKVNHEISPIYNKDSKILILGSIPSPKSRENGFYYAHSQNKFWKVLSNIFHYDIPNNNEMKKEFLLKNNIALWDVIASCEIKGASDTSIKNVQVNDINMIINNSKVNAIFTTGKKANDLYMKYCYPNTKIESIYLPSTSPANCANYSFEDLVEEYRIILDYLK